MKNISLSILALCFAMNALGQITVTKPKVDFKKPKVESGSNKSSSNESAEGIGFEKDPSGLFNRVSNDPSAKSHRAEAVKNLELLEAEYAKSIVNYSEAEELMAQIDKRIGMILKLEPNVDKEKFDERYIETKQSLVADLEVINPMKEMSKTLRTKFHAYADYQEIEVIAYRKPKGYNANGACYCRDHDQTSTYAEYQQLKNDYIKAGARVPKYRDEAAEKSIEAMDKCLENSLKYIDFVANDSFQKEIVEFNKNEKPGNPSAVISKCETYLAALDQIKTDPSLNLPQEYIDKLDKTKTETLKIKKGAEEYISSGDFEKHKAAVRAERAKLVEMPVAVAKAPALETQAINYILKGQAFKNYLASTYGDAKKGNPVSSIKAVTMHSQPVVKKNEFDIPVYQYKEIVVAYKDEDGLCQIVSVYAEYVYKGGGVYASEPTWTADAPIQIACENITK